MLDMPQNRLQTMLAQRGATANRLNSMLPQRPQFQNNFQVPQYAAPQLPAMTPYQAPANPFAGMPQKTGNWFQDMFNQTRFLKENNLFNTPYPVGGGY
jgi:hypothetical protein